MSIQTFEEAVSAAKVEDGEVTAIKQTFVEPLKELTKLKAQWDKQRPQFQNRLSLVHHRVQQAITAGVNTDQVLRLVGPLIRDLERRWTGYCRTDSHLSHPARNLYGQYAGLYRKAAPLAECVAELAQHARPSKG